MVEWVQAPKEELLYLSVLTPGEIRKGRSARLLEDLTQRIKLEPWLVGELVVRFADRIPAIDEKIAERWGSSDRPSQATANRTLP